MYGVEDKWVSGSREWSTPQNAPERYGNRRGCMYDIFCLNSLIHSLSCCLQSILGGRDVWTNQELPWSLAFVSWASWILQHVIWWREESKGVYSLSHFLKAFLRLAMLLHWKTQLLLRWIPLIDSFLSDYEMLLPFVDPELRSIAAPQLIHLGHYFIPVVSLESSYSL